jgi:hypothetical protein
MILFAYVTKFYGRGNVLKNLIFTADSSYPFKLIDQKSDK